MIPEFGPRELHALSQIVKNPDAVFDKLIGLEALSAAERRESLANYQEWLAGEWSVIASTSIVGRAPKSEIFGDLFGERGVTPRLLGISSNTIFFEDDGFGKRHAPRSAGNHRIFLLQHQALGSSDKVLLNFHADQTDVTRLISISGVVLNFGHLATSPQAVRSMTARVEGSRFSVGVNVPRLDGNGSDISNWVLDQVLLPGP